LDGVLVFWMHAEDEDGGFGELGLEVPDHIQAVSPGHGDVEDDQLAGVTPRQSQEVLSVVSLIKDLHIGFIRKDLSEPSAYNGVVVGDEDANHGCPLRRLSGNQIPSENGGF
jgi:hypothetical protein